MTLGFTNRRRIEPDSHDAEWSVYAAAARDDANGLYPDSMLAGMDLSVDVDAPPRAAVPRAHLGRAPSPR